MDIKQKQFLGEKVPESDYKVIEYNSTETYTKITWVNAEGRIARSREIFTGVAFADKGTISTTIDDTKTVIIRY